MKKSSIVYIVDIILIILFLLFFCKLGSANEHHAGLIINNAYHEIGHGEIGGNNKGLWVKKYNDGLEAAWCAGFVSYILEKSNVRSIKPSRSAKALWNQKKYRVKDPQPGDIICFWRDNPKSWKGHVGIVYEVKRDKIITIEGNVGAYPSVVKKFTYKRDEIPKLLGFIRP